MYSKNFPRIDCKKKDDKAPTFVPVIQQLQLNFTFLRQKENCLQLAYLFLYFFFWFFFMNL